MFERVGRHHQWPIDGCREGFACEVVGSRTQAASGNHKLGTRDRTAKNVDRRLQLITDGGVIENSDS